MSLQGEIEIIFTLGKITQQALQINLDHSFSALISSSINDGHNETRLIPVCNIRIARVFCPLSMMDLTKLVCFAIHLVIIPFCAGFSGLFGYSQADGWFLSGVSTRF